MLLDYSQDLKLTICIILPINFVVSENIRNFAA